MKYIDGADVDGIRGCKGLPATPGVTYTLLKYNRAIRLTLSGAPVVIPADAMDDVCLLLDVCSGGGCSGSGGVAFLLSVPQSAIAPLAGAALISNLKANDLHIDALRLGVGGHLEVSFSPTR